MLLCPKFARSCHNPDAIEAGNMAPFDRLASAIDNIDLIIFFNSEGFARLGNERARLALAL
jgi:hypothetical protein